MMELLDLPDMSAQFRICRMWAANSKMIGGTLNGNVCAPKLRVPKIWVGVQFCMRGAPFREKGTRRDYQSFRVFGKIYRTVSTH